jgi:2-polyprenyl-6-methoxyphenol hydroxylase-like FAD-dependent oxidoreductase
MAFFKIPRRPEDDKWACTVNGIGGTLLTLRPGNDVETTVLVTFLRKEQLAGRDTPAAQREMLDQALAGRGTLAERVRADLEAVDDFYFGPMSQVHSSTLSSGRVVLLGDAAYCPTPFTGQGTALALVGAYVLAGEIKRQPDHLRAFAAYERLVRPYAENSQQLLTPGRIRLMHPKSRWGIGLAHLVQRCVASALVQQRFRPTETKREQAIADDFAFADYS